MNIKDALEIGRLKEATIYAGKNGIENVISSITIMDIPNIIEWLNGGELLLSGILFEQCFNKKFIDELIAKKIPGIITKEKFAKRVSKELFKYCDAVNFPIIIAPDDCNWAEIMNPIISSIVCAPYKIIEETLHYHNTLMKSVIQGMSLTQICIKLSEFTEMSLAISDNDFYLLGHSNKIDWEKCTEGLSKYSVKRSGSFIQGLCDDKIYVYKYSNSYLKSISLKLLLYPVSLNRINYGYIIIALSEKTSELSATNIMKIQQLGLIVALNFTKQNEINNAVRKFNNLLLDDLLKEKNISIEEAQKILSPLGKKLHRYYYVVQFKSENQYNFNSAVLNNYKINKFYSTIERYIPYYNRILIFERRNSCIMLIPDSITDFEKLILKLRSLFIKILNVQNIYIGISDVTPINKISTAYIQSSQTANYLETVKIDKPFLYYNKLGILKFFIDNEGRLNESFLKKIYETYILPLKEHDKIYHSELLKTLETYFNNNCSKINTANKLYIHKNTLRARFASINKILNCNVDNSEDLFNIHLAIKLNYFWNT